MSMSSISVDKLAQNSHELSRAELKRLQSELNPSQIGAKLSWDTTILKNHQWRRKQSNIGCANHKIKPKYCEHKFYILLTLGPNIGCANVHPAHPAPRPLR